MLFSPKEIFDIFIAVVAGGFIFMDSFRDPHTDTKTFGERLLFSIAIAGPAIILHEFGHKFLALALGYSATFHAAFTWLGIGILLKLISFPILLVVPAYISIVGAHGLDAAMISFAGPAINGILWIGSYLCLKFGKKWTKTQYSVLHYTQTINMFLFIFNMLPIPGFDGYSFFMNLF